jgi:excisionase family DNA binding protein
MSYSELNLEEAADYLHLTVEQVEKLVRQGELPARMAKNRPVFEKSLLHDWITKKLLGENAESSLRFHRRAKELQQNSDLPDSMFLSQFLMPEVISIDLVARTKSGVLRELVKLSVASNLVTDKAELLRLVEEREQLHTTGLVNGVAMPHSRIHDEYLLLDSFLVIARLKQAIPFGAQDGGLTDLFFMPCADNNRIHLSMIARIALLLQKTDLADAIRACQSVSEVMDTINSIEANFVKSPSGKSI